MARDKFENYTYQNQARSINGRLSRLEAAIRANVEKARAEDKQNPVKDRIINLQDLVTRLTKDKNLHNF
jgi:hypothetical protein